MPINARILVVAPDLPFRRSLVFVLETEGCTVEVAEWLPTADELLDRYECIVVDHRSLLLGSGGESALAPAGIPLILLASRAQDMVPRGFTRVVEKPLLGHTLIEAVRVALGKESPCASTPTSPS